jgi:hypothetical protein
MTSRRQIEALHQKALFGWASRATHGGIKVGDYLHASANGGLRNKNVATDLKDQGVKAGVSDIFLPVPRSTMHGLWIELKRPKSPHWPAGRMKPEQIEWLDRMGEQGYAAVVCYGWESAMETIISYLESA